jgi:hypothetical protein
VQPSHERPPTCSVVTDPVHEQQCGQGNHAQLLGS